MDNRTVHHGTMGQWDIGTVKLGEQAKGTMHNGTMGFWELGKKAMGQWYVGQWDSGQVNNGLGNVTIDNGTMGIIFVLVIRLVALFAPR